jgi:hypothetical protein
MLCHTLDDYLMHDDLMMAVLNREYAEIEHSKA